MKKNFSRKGAKAQRKTPSVSGGLPLRLRAFAREILLLLIASFVFVSALATPQKPKPEPYGPPKTIATIKDKSISESSGLVASRSTPGAYWTHNDSGDGPFIYAFDTRGSSLGTFRVTGAQARDWEDMSVGPGPQRGKSYLYIGDIGDNQKARAEIIVYRVLEPA